MCVESKVLFMLYTNYKDADQPAHPQIRNQFYLCLSYDVASGSEITLCNKIDKPLVVYRSTGNVMTSITTLRT